MTSLREACAHISNHMALAGTQNTGGQVRQKGGRFLYSGYEAFGRTQDCVDDEYGRELYTAVQARGPKHRETDAMKRLIVSYTEQVQDPAACAEGPR